MKHNKVERVIGGRFLVFVMVLVAAAFVVQVSQARAKPIKLVFAHACPAGWSEEPTLAFLADKIKKEMKGRVSVKYFPSGELVNYGTMVKAVAGGSVDMAFANAFFLEEFDPRWRLLYTPMLIMDYEHFLRLTKTDEYKKLVANLVPKGIKIIRPFGDVGAFYFYTKKRIGTFEDYKGVKARVPSGKVFSNMSKRLGIIPVSLAPPEVVTALQTGLAEGVLTDFTSGVPYYELHKYTPHTTMVSLAHQQSFFIMNTGSLKKLPSDIKRDLMALYEEAQVWGEKYMRDKEQEQISAWKKDPNCTYFSAEKVSRMAKKMRSALEPLIQSVAKETKGEALLRAILDCQ